MTRRVTSFDTTKYHEILVDFSYFEKKYLKRLAVSRLFETFLRIRESKERDWEAVDNGARWKEEVEEKSGGEGAIRGNTYGRRRETQMQRRLLFNIGVAHGPRDTFH